MSDNYEFEKSSRPQDIDGYSPYVDKQYNGFINDLNGGVYTNTSLSLVQFDLGQIYNSQKFTDTNDMFMVIPIALVAAFSTGSAIKDPVDGNVNLLSMKTNFIHLIHQADLQINGKTIESTQPYVNIAKHFQMLSEMSVNDLATVGHSLGFGETIDNYRSVVWNGTTTTANGIGLTNNRIFAQTPSVTGAVTAVKFVTPGSRYQTSIQANQNTGTINDAITSKLSRYADTSGGKGYNNVFGTLISLTQLKNELRPSYEVVGAAGSKYMIWNDYAVIKLSTLFESLANIGLVRKFDCTLRLWLNTGTVNVTVVNPNVDSSVAGQLGYTLTTANNTFTNTCPFTVNYLPDLSANGGIPTGTTNIVAGCYVAKPPTTTFAGINLGSASVSNGLPTCRIYYSQIQVEPQKALTYVNENRNKKVVYRSILANQYNNLGAGSTFNQLVNSGVVHPVGILIIPYISSSVSGLGDFQWKSPFDTCPATSSPISLTNLQVSVGGVNQLQSTLNYNYENFIEQINLAEALTSSDMGISCGLFNQAYWEMFRHYYVNIERSNLTDKNVARNINISFNNNSLVATDILTFIIYSDTFVIDIESGLITK